MSTVTAPTLSVKNGHFNDSSDDDDDGEVSESKSSLFRGMPSLESATLLNGIKVEGKTNVSNSTHNCLIGNSRLEKQFLWMKPKVSILIFVNSHSFKCLVSFLIEHCSDYLCGLKFKR